MKAVTVTELQLWQPRLKQMNLRLLQPIFVEIVMCGSNVYVINRKMLINSPFKILVRLCFRPHRPILRLCLLS